MAKIPKIIMFILFYLKEMVLSNIRVTYDVLTQKHQMKPGVVAIPIKAKSNFEITVLANLISMTPGTLSLDISNDKKVLYIHSMYIDNLNDLKHEISEGIEKRVLEVLR
jgi:multicomponent Na+:H+ antiporter subunit E